MRKGRIYIECIAIIYEHKNDRFKYKTKITYLPISIRIIDNESYDTRIEQRRP